MNVSQANRAPGLRSAAGSGDMVQWLHSASTIDSLHYVRWKQGRRDSEVDLVAVDPRAQAPRFAVEVKWSDSAFDHWNELQGLRNTISRPMKKEYRCCILKTWKSVQAGFLARMN